MNKSAFTGIVLLMTAHGLMGCSSNSPVVPSPPPQAAFPTANPNALPPAVTPSGLIVFTEPRTGFSTSDLRDVQDQILQFNGAGELIWTHDNTRLPGYRVSINPFGETPSHYIEGRICPQGCAFVVRFGTSNGDRRAYLTVDYGHDNPGTVVDVEVGGGVLTVTQSTVFPPGSPTLSGVVTEMTPAGPVPVEGVRVYRGVQTGWRDATTDRSGFYSIAGLYDGVETVETRKPGYPDTKMQAPINGDTRLDIQLTPR